MKLVSWNMAHRQQAWHQLLEMDVDVALLQEAPKPPPEIASQLAVDDEPWQTGSSTRAWRVAVVRLSDRVKLSWLKPIPLHAAVGGDFAVSYQGTLAAAEVTSRDGEKVTVASMYGIWDRPHKSVQSSSIYADASVHRLISDLSALVVTAKKHRVIAAGDLNILYGYGDLGNQYWAARYATVFQRMEALGLPFVGPQFPYGRQAEPWPKELPWHSQNVPTYYTSRSQPSQAERQLDFVFASTSIAEKISVWALNQPEHWGVSDHCRILIELE